MKRSSRKYEKGLEPVHASRIHIISGKCDERFLFGALFEIACLTGLALGDILTYYDADPRG
jgi:hypothetical protein